MNAWAMAQESPVPVSREAVGGKRKIRCPLFALKTQLCETQALCMHGRKCSPPRHRGAESSKHVADALGLPSGLGARWAPVGVSG